MYNVKTNCPPHLSTNIGKDPAITVTCHNEHGAYFHYQHLWISWNLMVFQLQLYHINSGTVGLWSSHSCRMIVSNFKSPRVPGVPRTRLGHFLLHAIVTNQRSLWRRRIRLSGAHHPLQLKNQGQNLEGTYSIIICMYHIVSLYAVLQHPWDSHSNCAIRTSWRQVSCCLWTTGLL